MQAGNQTTLLNQITLPEFSDLVRRNFKWVQDNHPRNAKQLFISDNIGSGNGNSKSYQEVDKQKYASVKPEGANHQKAKVGVGYGITMLARTFSKEIDVTLEMRNDNRYQEVGSLLRDLSNFCESRMDLDLTHRFTFANATSYTDMDGYTIDTRVGDGFALCYETHKLAFSNTTYSNVVPGNPGFSQSAYETALNLTVTNLFNNFGEKITMDFNTIVTGDDPTTVRQVRQMLQSTADVDATQAGVKNVYSGSKRHVILPDLATTASGGVDNSKRRVWFVVASGQGVNGWQAYFGNWISPRLITPTTGSNGEDIHNLNWTYATYCRYGIAVLSGRGIIGSFPTN